MKRILNTPQLEKRLENCAFWGWDVFVEQLMAEKHIPDLVLGMEVSRLRNIGQYGLTFDSAKFSAAGLSSNSITQQRSYDWQHAWKTTPEHDPKFGRYFENVHCSLSKNLRIANWW
jgi:hypothetical protein